MSVFVLQFRINDHSIMFQEFTPSPTPSTTGSCKTVMNNYSNDYYNLLLIYSRMHSELLDYRIKK